MSSLLAVCVLLLSLLHPLMSQSSGSDHMNQVNYIVMSNIYA